jgi:hypothetical protein
VGEKNEELKMKNEELMYKIPQGIFESIDASHPR